MTTQYSNSGSFHDGETVVQARFGVRESIAARGARFIRQQLPQQHRDFYAQLPWLIVAARDARGQPQASCLSGAPGFIATPSESCLQIAAAPLPSDALHGALRPGDDIGVLGIEPLTQRRNRANGVIAPGSHLEVRVTQAFGNCPKYICKRAWDASELQDGPVEQFSQWTASAAELIGRADTFFIASGYRGEGDAAGFGMDASHRGGEPGFVSLQGARGLSFPDYRGNNLFNTLGNLERDPRCGLLFIDFDTGRWLQLTGNARLQLRQGTNANHDSTLREVLFELNTGRVVGK